MKKLTIWQLVRANKPGTLRVSNHTNAEHFFGCVYKSFVRLGNYNGTMDRLLGPNRKYE